MCRTGRCALLYRSSGRCLRACRVRRRGASARRPAGLQNASPPPFTVNCQTLTVAGYESTCLQQSARISEESTPMAKRNPYDARCSVCRVHVRALKGVVEASDAPPWYRILCPEHMSAGALDPPSQPAASKFPSIHPGDERERPGHDLRSRSCLRRPRPTPSSGVQLPPRSPERSRPLPNDEGPDNRLPQTQEEDGEEVGASDLPCACEVRPLRCPWELLIKGEGYAHAQPVRRPSQGAPGPTP